MSPIHPSKNAAKNSSRKFLRETNSKSSKRESLLFSGAFAVCFREGMSLKNPLGFPLVRFHVGGCGTTSMFLLVYYI